MSQQIPIVNQAGWDMLMDHILKPSGINVAKKYEQLVVDEVKRHIAQCVAQHFKVQS